jgi:hypothetical protein
MNYKIFWFIKEGGIGAQKFFLNLESLGKVMELPVEFFIISSLSTEDCKLYD